MHARVDYINIQSKCNENIPQLLFQAYSPLALAEATVVRVEWYCQTLEYLDKSKSEQ
jgi:hypothetical protein